MIGVIRVNDKNGNKIAECEIKEDGYGNFLLINSDNVKKVYKDVEQTDTQGFVDVIDIDVDNTINEAILKDLLTVQNELGAIEGAYETDEYGREKVVGQAVGTILATTDKYEQFTLKYVPSEWDKEDNTFDDIELSQEDFYYACITDENYCKAEQVIVWIASEFMDFLKKKL